MTMIRNDAESIWQAGVDAVDSSHLVQRHLSVDARQLRIGSRHWPLDQIRRMVVVGAGKAGAGMSSGLEQALGSDVMRDKQLQGWINVPADCQRSLQQITLHPARPAGCNEPTAAGVYGSNQILDLVRGLGPGDLCLCLISGGGSALLPAPRPGIELEDLLLVTQQLSAAGASIQQLNAVRKRLSVIQGGRLAVACGADELISLVISDVMGDPLEIIASGPTVLESDLPAAARHALDIFDQFAPLQHDPARYRRVRAALEEDLTADFPQPRCRITNCVIGNNETAVQAAAAAARSRGYQVVIDPPQPETSQAESIGAAIIDRLCEDTASQDWCLISGGEPVVQLAPKEVRGRGGRNQQLVLAALHRLRQTGQSPTGEWALLSGGTDGEDGPTDAAGAVLDAQIVQRGGQLSLDERDYLDRNDAYTFFEQTGGLLKTGPTHTNVCDLRVALRNAAILRRST